MVDERQETSSGHGGLYAILVVIVILLVGGFLYFDQRGGDEGPDIELNVPAPEGPGEGGGVGGGGPPDTGGP